MKHAASQVYTATILVQIRDAWANRAPSILCSLQAKTRNEAQVLLHMVDAREPPLENNGVLVSFSGYLST